MRVLPVVAGAALLVCAAAGGAGWVATAGDDGPPAAAAAEGGVGSTATVRRGDLTASTTSSGALEYADPRSLLAEAAGTVTWLPAAGRVVREGQALYRLDTAPVVRLDGRVPAWRDLAAGVEEGADVAQLESALLRLGYGADVDLDADGEWTWATTHAVEEWQEDHDMEETGSLPLGSVVFTDGDVRVSGRLVEKGARVQPATPVLELTGVGRQVSVSLATTQRHLVPIGEQVDLDFADGSTARGRIVDVELTPGADEESEDTLTVTIEPRGRAARRVVSAQLDGASVVVTASNVIAADVLVVPVVALVALDSGGYAVEVMDGARSRLVPVETDGFADTEVAVSGDLAEGDEVVVP